MHFETDNSLNEIKICGNMVMHIGEGWTVADVWFDNDIPSELIDCILVKFVRVKKPQPERGE